MAIMKSPALALAAVLIAVAGLAGGTPAAAGDTGSRILESPSRDVIHRNEPVLRSIVPGGNRTSPRSLSGRIGDLEAAGGLGQARQSPTMNCVLHHQRLERTARQAFATGCDPTVDRGAGYPAFTTR